MSTTPIYGFTEWAGPMASPWDAVNAAFRLTEALLRGSVADRDLNAPPGSCADGAAYLIAGAPTGAWAGHAGAFAVAVGADAANGWLFATITTEGFVLWVEDENLYIHYYAAAWSVFLGTVAALDVDTDGTLAANSDLRVPSQKAVKTAIAAAVTGLLDLKGGTDCSANPNYPAASKGDAYLVTVAGKIGGAAGKAVDVGDTYVAFADNAGGTEAAVGASWFVLEHNLSGVMTTGGGTFTGDIEVPDEAYGVGWNGSTEAPTKNAIYDKIEAVVAGIPGTYTDEMARDAVGAALTDTGLAVVTPNDGADTIDINVPAASGAEYRTGTSATKALTPDAVWDGADYVALNDSGGNIAVDFSTGINFTMTMDGDYTLSAPTNGKPGQTGVIVLTQDGTGTQTLAYNAVWKFAGGDPVLSTAAGSVDLLFYQVLPNGTDVFANLVKAIA